MPPDLLTTKELDRATLERQHLLRRVVLDPLTVVEQLGQYAGAGPLDPYTGLRSRIERAIQKGPRWALASPAGTPC